MQYIGFTGEKQSGKSTLAMATKEVYPGTTHVEISDIVTEVANDMRKLYVPVTGNEIYQANHWLTELPGILRERLKTETTHEDFAFDQSDVDERPADYMSLLTYTRQINEDPSFKEVLITPENKLAHRAILQALGGAVVAVKPNAWFEEGFKRINRERNSLTTLGLISTVAYPSDADYVRERGGIIVKVIRPDQHSKLGPQTDPTDRERSLIVEDITVLNNGSYEQLIEAGKYVVSLVQHKKVPSTIVCSEL